MGNEADNKYTWVIKNLTSLPLKAISSDHFVIGGCKWRLSARTVWRFRIDYLCLFLDVVDRDKLPSGWRIHARYLLTVVNQKSEKSVKQYETEKWFDQSTPLWVSQAMLPLKELLAKNGGFIVNNEFKVVAEINVLEVIGRLDVSETAIQPLKKMKLENDRGAVSSDLHKESSSVKKNIDVNGFQVLPSQAEFVKRMFERHPDIAVEFRAKSRHLKAACMNILLSLILTLHQSLQDLSNDDLVEADNALIHLKHSGFKVEWLEKKLDHVKEKKKEEQIGETRTQELEQDLKDFKQKCSDIEAILEKEKEELRKFKQKCVDIVAQLEEEKAKLLVTRAGALTLDDIIR